jgi:hypothetical protein
MRKAHGKDITGNVLYKTIVSASRPPTDEKPNGGCERANGR